MLSSNVTVPAKLPSFLTANISVSRCKTLSVLPSAQGTLKMSCPQCKSAGHTRDQNSACNPRDRRIASAEADRAEDLLLALRDF